MMTRRAFVQSGLAATIGSPLLAALSQDSLEAASSVLASSVANGSISSAVLHVEQRDLTFTSTYGKVGSANAMFLLGSISKPICVTALMTLYDKGAFHLDDLVQKFIPNFKGNGRESITLRHLLTHTSGLPDQLPENDALRKRHASLLEFVEHAIQAPTAFAAGTRYSYSSMGILLATRIAELISSMDIKALVDQTVFQPLSMQDSAQGLGRFSIDDFVPVQTEFAAIEAGGGDPSTRDWDWNSSYWRSLGAPWGGTHSSALDLAKFLREFLYEQGKAVRPETAKLMVTNQNTPGMTARGIGFNLGRFGGNIHSAETTFGHTGSTGTLAFADPTSQIVCVVLTSLPGTAINPHPREVAAAKIF